MSEAPVEVQGHGPGAVRTSDGARAPSTAIQCDGCGAPLIGGRPDRRFCSGACRARTSRERRAESERARLRAELAAELDAVLVRLLQAWASEDGDGASSEASSPVDADRLVFRSSDDERRSS